MKIEFAILPFCLFAAALAVEAAPCVSGAANLVTNCGFETGDLTGWTTAGVDLAPEYNGIDYGVDMADAHSGQFGAYIAGFGGVLSLQQTLATTPGATYQISFWLATPAPPDPTTPYLSGTDILFGSTLLQQVKDPAASPYTLYTYAATADSASTVLSLGFRSDTDFFSLDDISVTAAPVPEPVLFPILLAAIPALVAVGRRRRKLVSNGAEPLSRCFLCTRDVDSRVTLAHENLTSRIIENVL